MIFLNKSQNKKNKRNLNIREKTNNRKKNKKRILNKNNLMMINYIQTLQKIKYQITLRIKNNNWLIN